MLSLDKFIIERVAQCVFPVLIDGTLHDDEMTYEPMSDLVMFARTCHNFATVEARA